MDPFMMNMGITESRNSNMRITKRNMITNTYKKKTYKKRKQKEQNIQK